MSSFTSRCLTLVAAGSMAFTVACGGETAVTTNDGNRIDDNNYEAPDTLTETANLLHVAPCDATSSSCARTMSVGDSIDLKVQLLDADGAPIRNAFIDFDLQTLSGAEGASLNALRAATDSEGIASVTFRSRDDNPAANMGSVEITASVRDMDEISPRVFTVGISTKEGGSYIINYNHGGEATPSRVHTFVLHHTVSCEEATDEFFASGFWPPALVTLPSAAVYPNGDIGQVIYPQVSNGETFTIVGVARQTIGSQDVDVAYGCSDDNPPVEMGRDVEITVDLHDHLPNIRGIYDVTHRFNLTDALPPAVQTVISLIDTLVSNPAAFILGCPSATSANEADQWCNSGDLGLVDLLIQTGLLGDFEDQVETFRNSAFFPIAMDFLNDLIRDALPDWANSTLNIAGDITSMLQEFTVNGRMRFNENPDLALDGDQVVGFLHSENNIQYWDALIFTWSQGCEGQGPSCSQVTVSANQVGPGTSNIIEGNFGAQLWGASSLEIEEHSLTLHYGDLLLAAIENVVLPRIFGPEIQSLEALLDGDNGPGLLSCNSFAANIADEGTATYNTVRDLCRTLRDQAVTAVRNTISEQLVADGDNHFRLKTPSNEPCTVYQPTNYQSSNWAGFPRPYIETLGQAEASLRCKWSADIRFSQNSDPLTLGGTFHGELDRLLQD